jgi:hypothetical protein
MAKEDTCFTMPCLMTAYKNPKGAVVKNNTIAMQKSNKLFHKGM